MDRRPEWRTATLTIALCYLAAVFEGVDLQSMAIAAAKLRAEFHLDDAQYGMAASSSLAGLLFGAVMGGRLADRIGRKGVLIGSVALLGLFSLLTTAARDYGSLLAIRFVVGLGLGGAFPAIIALVSETVGGDRRARPISLMYAGIPSGTIIGTCLVLFYGAAFQWRWIFYLGGIGPLLLGPVLMAALPESAVFARGAGQDAKAPPAPVGEVLFGGGRARTTLLLWTGFFFTLLVIYLLTNWLNQLMTARGLDRTQSTQVLLCFGIGSIAGSLAMGAFSDSRWRMLAPGLTYAGVALSLVGLAYLRSPVLLLGAGLCAGFFAVGSQLINYALAPRYYPSAMRGTGLGWTTALGRFGSFLGPLVGGLLLNAGLKVSTVLVLYTPGLLVAAVAISLLLRAAAPADRADAGTA